MRVLMLAGVLALTAFAFHKHFEQRMQALNESHIKDSARILSKEDKAILGQWRKNFQDSLGMALLVQVDKSQSPMKVPAFPAATIFVGVNPTLGEAVLVVPPLAKKVLGEGQRLLAEEALAACIQEQKPAICLEQGLRDIFSKLSSG